MNNYGIYAIGAALVDTEITVTDADISAMKLDKGVMTLVDEDRQQELMDYLHKNKIAAQRASGGSGANTIVAAGLFGCSNFYSCKVANDDNGHFFLNDIKLSSVTYPAHLGEDEGITGKCLVMITPDAERTMNTFLGMSEKVSTTELNPEAIAAAEYIYIEGYLVTSESGRAAAIDLRQRAEKNDTLTSLSLSDPAMVQFFSDGLNEMIGNGVDLLFCNKDEALSFTKEDSIEAAAAALQKVAKSFAITLGGEGALVFDGNNYLNIAPVPTQAIDSNGAGDLFAGAFLYALTHKHSFQKAGDFASLCASKIVSQYGPRLKVEQYNELKEKFFSR